jgi:hypothetical protein
METFKGLTAGLDTNGQPVRLGEFDSDGHIVGYIDNDGLSWESEKECYIAIAVGRIGDHIKAHGTMPPDWADLMSRIRDEWLPEFFDSMGWDLFLRSLGEMGT